MPYVKNKTHRDMLFTSETPHAEFYTYSSVAQLAAKSESHKEDLMRCRTIGILHSRNGWFYLTDIEAPLINEEDPVLRVSMVYQKSPLQSTVIPYPVQIFGMLLWRNRPVVLAMIIQMLTTPMAIRIKAAMSAVTDTHLANHHTLEEEYNEDFEQLT